MNFLLIKNNYLLLSFLLIPVMSLWNPIWFSVMEIQPYWPIFWLLPWSILNGPINGVLTGFIIGIILDSLNNDIYTQVPGLLICGFWFGQLGQLKRRYQYGLIASLGSLICGFLYFSQLIIFNHQNNPVWLFSFGLKNIFGQVLLTGLFAPVLSTCLYEAFSKKLKKITLKRSFLKN
tara:strand:+ start:129 stop:659 length:531 start_codon:yes stop_codon:yes gene_type:complete